ncbi:MAG: hypothetical protein AAGA23_08320 [Pseudomonadota bacterium]
MDKTAAKSKPEALPPPWVLLVTAELETLVKLLEAGDGTAAINFYRRAAGLDLATARRHLETLAQTLGLRSAEEKLVDDETLAGLQRQNAIRTLLWLGFALALVGALLGVAFFVSQADWLEQVLPGGLFLLGTVAALKIRSEGAGAGLIVLGIVMILAAGLAIVGLRDGYPGQGHYLYATAPYFAAILLLGAGCGLAIMQVGWRQDDATALAPRSDAVIRGRRLARPIARVSVFVTVYTTAFVLHRHIISHEMNDALFNSLFRFLLAVPLIGVLAAITTAVAADNLRRVLLLALLPLLTALAASFLWGSGQIEDVAAELALIQILASLVAVAWIVARSQGAAGWRGNPLLATAITAGVVVVPALLIWGMAAELIQAAVDRGMLSGDVKTWLPFVLIVIWVGIDLGGGTRIPDPGEND